MKKTFDKKQALKLINQYADNYKRLEEENKSLLKEINDLKSNLIVNKNIIDSLLKNNSLDVKVKGYLLKSKEELDLLNERNAELMKENTNLRIKSLKYETAIDDSMALYRDFKDTLANKVFLLENSIKKKDSMIAWLNKKLKALRESDFHYEYSNEAHEVYICDPNESLNSLYGDLLLYKQAFENSLVRIKENQAEIARLQKRVDFYSRNCKDKEKDTKSTLDELNTFLLKCQKKTWETDEWFAILNYLNITKEDIDKHLPNNKFLSKVFEAIELLNKVVIQRNHQLAEAMKERDRLKEENSSLNNEHLGLMKTVFALKSKLEEISQRKIKQEDINEQYINTNISMVNNISLDDLNKKDVNYTIGFNIKDSILNQFKCNQSMTLENNHNTSFNKSESSLSKSISLTQVSESNFDIIESSDFISSINKKQLKRIKANDATSPSMSDTAPHSETKPVAATNSNALAKEPIKTKGN